jgi:hypothetical protein
MFKCKVSPDGLLSSKLYSQDDFYKAFLSDLSRCKTEVIIESPFITEKRAAMLLPVIKTLRKRRVRVIVNTRDPAEHEWRYKLQAEEVIAALHDLDVLVLYTAVHHRKIAILDKTLLWEGSLNILSHNNSCEMMRRTYSEQLANQMLAFTHLQKFAR